ncbi:MAG: efflux RND transporter periplasmic adaptor subunit [Burkholderiales bacterium]|nr:MAG: efflux RND transporter periplasmic adaptor subunit [Burkholderiales bacterium]
MTRSSTPRPAGRRPTALAATLAAALVLAACGARESAPAAGATPGTAPAAQAGAPSPAPAAQAGAPSPSPAAAPTADGKSAPRPALVVNVVRPERAELADTLSANGSVAAWQEATVGAEVNGLRIAEVRAEVGDTVRRGQVLVTFAADTVRADVANAQAALAEARAAVGEAQASAAEAQSNAERARQVESSGALSAQQIAQYQTAAMTAQARLASAQARVQSAQAQLQSQDLRLRMTQVHAPDDGVISARAATVGAVVPAGQELFRLVRGNRLEWRAEVTASELARLKPKQAVRVLPASGGEIAGTVRAIGPVVDAQTRNTLVYVDLPVGGPAKAGMFARGEFLLGGSGGLVVPQQAIVVRDGFSYVFRVEGGRAVQQKVRTGRRDGERIEVIEGLTAEASVVARGAGFLNDGDVVQVVAAAGGAK